ncbi:MAG: Rhodanese-related sulfurtransferase [Chitinophagaceae bacterium]|nr:Rhodanese-related sulfurtransferase [Chitinophagaceae bacterium]
MSQYKNDNVLFRTVDPSDLCNQLQQNKGYLLLDVRSAGEHFDTSSFAPNIGRLKGARNIDVRELGKRINEIGAYKNQPVFVYCSHSQRSRRASKMLADSGFTKVFNINGGMTAIHYTGEAGNACLNSLLVTSNGYKIVAPAELCGRLSGNRTGVFLLDVRSDSAFRHITSDDQANAFGSFKNAVNIPLVELPAKLSMVPHDKEIIVTDLFGGEAAKAAAVLKANGYNNVSVMIEGLTRWFSMTNRELPCKWQLYTSPVSYEFLSTGDFGELTKKNNNYLLLDVRSADEFVSHSKDSWRNIGHLKNAVNIPTTELSTRLGQMEVDKNKMIIVYAFSGSTTAYTAANWLAQKGYKNVKLLINGLFDIRWSAANRKGYSDLADLVIDIPDENL